AALSTRSRISRGTGRSRNARLQCRLVMTEKNASSTRPVITPRRTEEQQSHGSRGEDVTTTGGVDTMSMLDLKPESKELISQVGDVARACARRADHYD